MSEIILFEGPAPATPTAGGIVIYAKVDGRLYWKDDVGVETPFYPTGAGTGDLLADGSVPLTANWDVGAFQIRALQFYADATTGTAPLLVDSTTLVANLNADLLDGNEGAAYVLLAATNVSTAGWVLDEDNMVSDDATKVPTQQSVKAYVDSAVIGLFTDKGNYDASTNTPDLDVSPSGILQGDVYTVSVAGQFFTEDVEVGDVLRALQDNPTTLAHWARTQTNLTAPSIKTLYESNADTNEFSDAEQTKLAGIEAAATADQTDGEIETAYNNQVAAASQAEMEAGTETGIRRMTPQRVAQAIAALGFDGTGYVGVNNQTGTSYTLVLADAGKLITMNNAAANTLQIPANSSVAFAVGTRIDVLQLGAGQTTNAITTDTLHGNAKISAQYEVVSLLKIASTTWVVVGGVA